MSPQEDPRELVARVRHELRVRFGSWSSDDPVFIALDALAALPRQDEPGLRAAAQAVVDVWNPIVSINVPPTLNRVIADLEAALDRSALSKEGDPS